MRHILSLTVASLLAGLTHAAVAQAPDGEVFQLPGMSVIGSRAANADPAASFAAPVTLLRFQPFIDVQSRGFAEAQADVAIRGGTFENTGFKLGAVNLFDPQTGHYFSELPVDPAMLTHGSVLTGAANALHGFNSTVGTGYYQWMPLRSGGVAEAGLGTDSLYFARTAAGYASEDGVFLGRRWGVQVSAAYSEGDGTVEFGDHEFQRYGARLQLADDASQTDLYAGWQTKFYGWPGMYTGNAALQETDDYDVLLLVFNHTQEYGDASHWSAGAYFRKLEDDYELDRDRPGFFRPYLHETRVLSAAAEGRHRFGTAYRIDWRGEVLADEIESTELVHAGFMDRNYYKATLLPGVTYDLDRASLDLSAGATWDDSSRDGGSLSPIVLASYTREAGGGIVRTYGQYTRSTQVAGYTALGSSPAPGAFAGNAALPREAANNYEVGLGYERGHLQWGASAFFRQHHNLADWTYDVDQPGTFRRATPVDLDVWGVESYAGYSSESLTITVSYAWLNIASEYEDPEVDASFYALNFPEQRLTAAVLWRPIRSIELRVDGEARRQERNIRRTSDNEAFLANASITWQTPLEGLSLSVLADNVTNSGYQEFPGVPADGRQLALRTTFVW